MSIPIKLTRPETSDLKSNKYDSRSPYNIHAGKESQELTRDRTFFNQSGDNDSPARISLNASRRRIRPTTAVKKKAANNDSDLLSVQFHKHEPTNEYVVNSANNM